jgi:hypothetical protein
MAVYQIDTEKQTFSPHGGHNYAWTNVYLVDVADDAAAHAAMLTIAGVEIEALPDWTSIRFACWRPGIGGPVPEDNVEILGYAGLLESDPQHFWPLANTARILGWDGGKLVWFKRWRGPFRLDDVSGGLLTAEYRTILEGMVTDLLAAVPMVTRSGRPISTWAVDSRISLWQVRDGTERERRSVLAG